jgi:hypothetical protein
VSKILDRSKVDTHHPLPKPSPGFYHTNHLIIKITVQTTPQATACYPPKKPGTCHGLFFCLQADAPKKVTGEYGLGELR